MSCSTIIGRLKALWSEDRFTFIVTILSITVFMSVIGIHVLSGRDTVVLIHDNLDSTFTSYEVLARNNALLSLSNETITGILGGVPAYALKGTWLHRASRAVFSPFASYQLVLVIQRAVAFAGMLWVSWKFLLPAHRKRLAISAVVAMAFATLPFYQPAGLSVAGLPWATGIIWSGLNQRVKSFHVAGLLLLALSSSLVLSWLFFIPLAIVALLAVHFWGRSGRLHGEPGLRSMRTAWVYLGLFVVFLAATRWIELVGALFLEEPTIRSEFVRERGSLGTVLRTSLSFFLRGQYHAHSLHYIVFPLAFLGFGGAIGRTKRVPILISVIGALLVAIAGIYGLYRWSGVVPLERLISPLQQLNWSRFHWLVPLLWWSLAALALAQIGHAHRRVFMVALVGTLAFQAGLNTLYSDPVAGARRGDPTFRQFFAEQLFDEVRSDMNARDPNGLAVAVGMHPSVLQYNEIHTLDGYLSTAPLSRKRMFEVILEEELAKNEVIRNYLSDWGGRLYVYSDDLQRQSGDRAPQVYKWTDYSIEDLAINTDALYEYGARFVVSATPIGNAGELGLTLVDSYTHGESAWDVWLYQING